MEFCGTEARSLLGRRRLEADNWRPSSMGKYRFQPRLHQPAAIKHPGGDLSPARQLEWHPNRWPHAAYQLPFVSEASRYWTGPRQRIDLYRDWCLISRLMPMAVLITDSLFVS